MRHKMLKIGSAHRSVDRPKTFGGLCAFTSICLLALFACGDMEGADLAHWPMVIASASHKPEQPGNTAGERPREVRPQTSKSDPLEKAKVGEILGEPQQDRQIRRFFELVVLPLGVCFLLAMLLRRGFLD